jgi:hypothetical protein
MSSHQGGGRHTNQASQTSVEETLQQHALRQARAREQSTRAIKEAPPLQGTNIDWSSDGINKAYRRRLRSFKDT